MGRPRWPKGSTRTHPNPGVVLLSSSSFFPPLPRLGLSLSSLSLPLSELPHAPSHTSMTRDHCHNYLQCSREPIRRSCHDHRMSPLSPSIGTRQPPLVDTVPDAFPTCHDQNNSSAASHATSSPTPQLIVEIPKYPFRPAWHSTRSKPAF
ncbi:hypothetical protein BC826DRAFT_448552 [Russula brevipes]|nr:hypothetical protein BC826DRAFT_448552 [Russula brevipes]